MLALMALAVADPRPNPTDPEDLREEVVVVLTRALPAGHDLRLGDYTALRMRARTIQVDAVPLDAAFGRVLAGPLYKGAVLRAGHLTKNPDTGLDALVPDGFRRVKLPLARPSLSIRAGDDVDVLDVARRCLHEERVRVLAIHTADGRVLEPWSSVPATGLEVALPQDTVRSVLASKPDDLAYLPRNPVDNRRVELMRCKLD